MPAPVGDGHIGLSRIGIIITAIAWLFYVVWWAFTDLLGSGVATPLARFEAVIYLVIVTLLTSSSLAYLLSRLGYMYRSRTHHRANRAELDSFYDHTTPTLTTIVPSYQEDARVIRKTLLSAALQEYPDKRVVLLIDDPHEPRTQRARDLLDGRPGAVPGQVQELLAGPVVAVRRGSRSLRGPGRRIQRHRRGRACPVGGPLMTTRCAGSRTLPPAGGSSDHTDAFFANDILRRLARDLRTIAVAIRRANRTRDAAADARPSVVPAAGMDVRAELT